MKKYWFKHHGKASTDPRMRMLKDQHGYAGVGVYWDIVERIETWGDGQYPRRELIDLIRSPRATTKTIVSVLDDFFLFDRNEFGDMVLSGIPVGECYDFMLEELLKQKRREEERRRLEFERQQQLLPFMQEPPDDDNVIEFSINLDEN